MWKYGIIVFVYSVAVRGEMECSPGKYGKNCNLDCPEYCRTVTGISYYCNKDDGKCSEGCIAGFYGDQCIQACSKNCKYHTCNQDSGKCSVGCTENHLGDFCEITQGTSNDRHTTVTTNVTPTTRSSVDHVVTQVIIPVVVVTVLVLVGSVCTVIILMRCRKKVVRDPEEHELLPINSNNIQVEREDTDLHIACKHGQVEGVKHALSESLTGINSRGLYGWTPLMTAARYGHRGVFDFLVSKGCDEEMVDDSGNSILHVACLGGDLKLVKSILSKEIVGINSRGHRGRTPIMAAARMGHNHVLKTLLRLGSDASLIDEDGNNILHYACIGGHLVVVQYILNKNIVDINSKGKHGMAPVMVSVEDGHRHVFDFLVNKGADLSQVDDNGNNILHVACNGGNIKMAKHILSQNMIYINSKGQDGRTSVMAAVDFRCREVFEFLVSKGADLSLVDSHGNNILHLACSGGNVNMVEDLLTKDSVDINSRGQNGRTPLMWATWWQQTEVIDFLVSKGADTSLVDEDGNNILHYACTVGHLTGVQYILKRNIVDINSKGTRGMTPVMISVDVGHMHVFDFLLYKGADLSQVGDNRNNILHVACLSGRVVIVKYIVSKRIVDINSKGQFRRTPVMMAAQEGQRDVFILLVSKGADMSLVDENNDNILHLTCRVGHLEMVKFVLSRDIVDIDSTGQHKRTAVMIAAENGHEEVFSVLVNEGANLSNVDASGNNILHLACLGRSESIVQNILSKNAIDINAMNNKGSKAVTIAREKGHSSIYQLLVSRPTN